MPVDYKDIQNQIGQIGLQAPRDALDLANRCQEAFEWLQSRGKKEDLVHLRQKVMDAVRINPNLRCAIPLDEPLTSHFPVVPQSENTAILAADGSQINPDRHASLQFGLINVGAFRMQRGTTPQEFVESKLLFGQELYTRYGKINEEYVALKRDLSERRMLANLAEKEIPPVVALTDGPIEPFLPNSGKNNDLEDLFREYLEELRKLAGLRVCAAGYVDKPGADLVVRLLELELLGEKLEQAGKIRLLQGVTDSSLFQRVLGPGERSAIFEIQSASAGNFSGPIALHFFYLNVGNGLDADMARVEIPAWVAHDPKLVELLHFTLIDQCRQLGNKPYPYVLHRAHEVAVVRFTEKDHILQLLERELLSKGLMPGQSSHKQAVKDLSAK
jgi:hypothetical protein